MTLRELEQYRDQKREVELLQRQIDGLTQRPARIVSDTVQASMDKFPYTPYTATIRGVDQSAERRHARLLGIYHRRLAELEQEQMEVEQWIASLEDSKLRRIVTLRYVQGWSWRRVGSEVYGSALSESAARMRVERFFMEN